MKKSGCKPGELQVNTTCLDKKDIKKMFLEHAYKTWDKRSQKLLKQIDIDVSIQKCKGYMAVVRNIKSRPFASEDSLLRTPKNITLQICDNFKDVDLNIFKKLMGHETLHLGYPRHDKYFRYIARKKGIPLTFHEAMGGKIELRGKPHSERYYRHIKYFDTEKDAKAYMKDHPYYKSYKWEIVY